MPQQNREDSIGRSQAWTMANTHNWGAHAEDVIIHAANVVMPHVQCTASTYAAVFNKKEPTPNPIDDAKPLLTPPLVAHSPA